LILELSTNELVDYLTSVRPRIRLGGMTVQDVVVVPMKGVRTLMVFANVTSQSTKGVSYRVSLQFKNVSFDEIEGPGNLKIVYKGYTFYVRPVTRDHDVNVRCSCPDFRFRWGYYDQVNKALYGAKYPPPRSKTRPANPWKIPALCKHILKVVEYLYVKGFLK